ncbi:MAG: hypothetical protein JXA57_20855 [Armatimonadetes bacterium]|nr:hypothetical protein [Armatimonadota bacterium]
MMLRLLQGQLPLEVLAVACWQMRRRPLLGEREYACRLPRSVSGEGSLVRHLRVDDLGTIQWHAPDILSEGATRTLYDRAMRAWNMTVLQNGFDFKEVPRTILEGSISGSPVQILPGNDTWSAIDVRAGNEVEVQRRSVVGGYGGLVEGFSLYANPWTSSKHMNRLRMNDEKLLGGAILLERAAVRMAGALTPLAGRELGAGRSRCCGRYRENRD